MTAHYRQSLYVDTKYLNLSPAEPICGISRKPKKRLLQLSAIKMVKWKGWH